MGDFGGHAVPGFFFLLFFVILFQRYLYNFRRTTKVGGGVSNEQNDAVERSSKFLIGLGATIAVSTFIGIMVEGLNGYFIDGHFFKFYAHEALYILHTMVGVPLFLEGLCLLPYDTSYYFLSLAKLLEFLVWWDHSQKFKKTEKPLHYYLALITFLMFVASAFVPSRPRSHRLRMYLAGGFLFEGVWMFAIGFILYCGQNGEPMLTPMQVPSFAVLVTVLICLFVAIPTEIYMHRAETIYAQSHSDCKYEEVDTYCESNASNQELA